MKLLMSKHYKLWRLFAWYWECSKFLLFRARPVFKMSTLYMWGKLARSFEHIVYISEAISLHVWTHCFVDISEAISLLVLTHLQCIPGLTHTLSQDSNQDQFSLLAISYSWVLVREALAGMFALFGKHLLIWFCDWVQILTHRILHC